MRAVGYDGWLNMHAEYDGRYAPVGAAGGRTSAAPQPWQMDPSGNLAETDPVVELLEADIAYLAKIVAGA